jgi:hypothetical protein
MNTDNPITSRASRSILEGDENPDDDGGVEDDSNDETEVFEAACFRLLTTVGVFCIPLTCLTDSFKRSPVTSPVADGLALTL